MVINGSFLAGHRQGFHEGAAAGWEAGYRQALEDTGAAPVEPAPQPQIEYIAPVKADLNKKLRECLNDGEISVRSFNCLQREGVHTVGDLVDRTEEELFDMRNLGAKSIDQLKAFLDSQGLGLKAASGVDDSSD